MFGGVWAIFCEMAHPIAIETLLGARILRPAIGLVPGLAWGVATPTAIPYGGVKGIHQSIQGHLRVMVNTQFRLDELNPLI